jgi:hypothetical protein
VTEAVEPGKWYLAVNCVYCGEVIPFAPAPEPGINLYPRREAITDLQVSALRARWNLSAVADLSLSGAAEAAALIPRVAVKGRAGLPRRRGDAGGKS